MRDKKLVIQSMISCGSYQEILERIIELQVAKKSSYVCVSNVHMTIEAYKNKSFMKTVNDADITTPDGMPLAKAMRLLYGIKQERVAGMDLMPSLMEKCEIFKKSIFLYGSTNEVLKKIIKKAKSDYPSLKIESYSPPFRKLSTQERQEVIHKINSNGYDYVFVALGCPKQEKWMNEHKNIIQSCMIGLGGAFEVYAEVKDRAPQWMQDYSLEWLYRFIQDPRRLWKRYAYTNSLFIILFIRQYLKIKLLRH